MSPIVYVDGEYVPADKAKVSMFDRGYIFGDGVYEVAPVIEGGIVDGERMLARLGDSLDGVGIAWPMEAAEIIGVFKELIARNGLKEGMVYMQITRGVAERDFAFPAKTLPVMTAFTKELSIVDNPRAETGVTAAFVDDVRWKLRNIKSISLLAQVLAKQQAVEKRAYEGWMVDEEGFITEGTSSSAHIVMNGTLITRPLEAPAGRILPGIRRSVILELAEQNAIPVEQRPFTKEEALNADEALMSSATAGVLPIVEIEGKPIGSGEPGPLAKRLRELYLAHALAQVSSGADDEGSTSGESGLPVQD